MIDLVNQAATPGVLTAADPSLRLDHIGIAVTSIASARAVYEALGMALGVEETVAHEQVKTAMLALGQTRLELLEPLAEDSTMGRFLTKRGPGVHHIALHTGDISAKFAALQEQGVRLVSDAIQIGAGGHSYFFVHPASTGGVLIEIVGDPPVEQARV
jgi:LAO/AO transport system kinase